METALVLSADRYEFSDEKTGDLRRGVTLQYITDYREDTSTSVGFKPIKAPALDEVFDAVQKSGTNRGGAGPALALVDPDEALHQVPCQVTSERDPPLTVTLDLEIPNNRVCTAEMDLVQAHLTELIRELLCHPVEDKE
jgi:hypothetical protein